MVIRKLFGPAFGGDKLTDKAMSNDATRTTEEIHEYIEHLASLEEQTQPPAKEPSPIELPPESPIESPPEIGITPYYGVGIGNAFSGVELTS